ncbi:uncharacterized protein I206_107704 [Kwoniella pini CBS 10737]|uniref:Uncharacterized protein n=1 Tax=Kwoniella pini CBS 10737 TaxID=1296096 RepID=A0A1B9HY34_9TREE|nr:uncharacterized protein I206_06038 [Kwoniella pini CBS 10737]OCF48170.1 hypothetical protein I206_06038 [Kwoniella pini CBS 10737]
MAQTYTYILSEGANVIAPRPTTGIVLPTSIMNDGGMTIKPSSILSTTSVEYGSTKSEMIITRPANLPLPTTYSSSTIQSQSNSLGDQSKDKKLNSNSNSNMNYNHTTLIIIIILSFLSIFSILLWYFKKSKTKKLLLNKMNDLESTFKEKKRNSISKIMINNNNRKSWIKLNEEICNIQEKEEIDIQVNQSQLHQVINGDQHIEVNDYNDIERQSHTHGNLSTTICNSTNEFIGNDKRNSTINHFPIPPSNIPDLPPLPPTPSTNTDTNMQHISKDIFQSNEYQINQVLSPEIGIATTNQIPASSSKSAITINDYPKIKLNGSSEKSLTKLENNYDESDSISQNRQSLPYVLPLQEAERTPTFISLSQLNQQAENNKQVSTSEYRSPTESMYVIYKERNTIYQVKQ